MHENPSTYFGALIAITVRAACATTGQAVPEGRSIRVNFGNVILLVQGHIEDPQTGERVVTRSETVNLSKNELYRVVPILAEVVRITVRSSDNNNAEISILGYGSERTFPVMGYDRDGVFLVFQSR